jgi:UDP-N-acetylglucosamine 4-epimerase
MASAFQQLKGTLRASPCTWVVTGVAGFIGSHLLQALLSLGQTVVGIDNFSTGHRRNLDDVRLAVGAENWRRFQLVEMDIATDAARLVAAVAGADYVLHQAALGSVPRSIADPVASHVANVTGFIHVLNAAREAKVRRFVYASSSSVYGDNETLPKIETAVGRPLSPYAATKLTNELYAGVFSRTYGLSAVGLRYFNVFGPRQDPNGPYAAVFPQWANAMLRGRKASVNGDGTTSRDFCYVENVVQANLLAATQAPAIQHEVFNVALNARTSLLELFEMMRRELEPRHEQLRDYRPEFRPARPGDIRHSQADISKAQRMLGYEPEFTVAQGLPETLAWYEKRPSLG